MKKLKNKVLLVTILILTIFLASILIVFNYQNYNREKNEIQSHLIRMNDIRDKEKPNRVQPPDIKEEDMAYKRIFMDSVVYTVIFDEQNNILEIISHTESREINDKIEQIAKEIINSPNKAKNKIGNLYFEEYSYSFKNSDSLTIIDNSNVQTRLRRELKTSILIFILLEIVIIFISKKLTNWMIRPAVESLEKQKQFIADASHELKTPVSVIMASSEALENDYQEKWINNIKNEAERMNRLITSLLNLSKIENFVEKELYSINNLSKIIENSSLTFEGLMYEKKIKLKTNIQENIYFNCNADQIKQLVAILLDNAIKYSIENGEIIILLIIDKNEIIFEVKNKGKAIPKEEQEKIFERFYRMEESRNRDENRYGLGLAIAKSIVLNHNGKISANSNEGYTSFKIKFRKYIAK